MNREQILQEQASARVYQERYDNALAPWGVRANAPTLGQDINDYRREHVKRIKALLPEGHELRSVKVWKLPADAFVVIEPQILAASSKSAFHPTSAPAGTIQRRESTDSNGHKSINFIGQESFVKQMMPPTRRVINFFVGNHIYDACKGRWR